VSTDVRGERDLMRVARSAALFESARQVIPGGVNSPVRAFGRVGGTPRFIDCGYGPYLLDVDGNQYSDYVLSWGALPLGHAHPAVVQAIMRQAARGTSYGAPTELETELATLITSLMPAIEMVRFVSSGTEAVMSALRVARAASGRRLVVKFDGAYHGHADSLLVSAGSGVATLALSDSAGVTASAVGDTVSIPFNDQAAVAELFATRGAEIAAILVEPVPGNMGLVLPLPGFLETLRELTTRHGALLIFDEVMTGARVAAGGAQVLYGIRPDLTCLGKVIGGGLPAAAYGGSRALMELVAPAGPVYQAGTLSGNPLAMAAGIATLRELSQPGRYERLTAASRTLCQGLRQAADQWDIPVQASFVGGMWGFFFAPDPVTDYASAQRADTVQFKRFFHACLDRGVYLPPSPFESCFVSLMHDEGALERTVRTFQAALRGMRERP
jgi:glutamate-1-semialdehyde 2,1-aminomutase